MDPCALVGGGLALNTLFCVPGRGQTKKNALWIGNAIIPFLLLCIHRKLFAR